MASPFNIPRQARTKMLGPQTKGERRQLQEREEYQFAPGKERKTLIGGFGSNGREPIRNRNFMSSTGFERWVGNNQERQEQYKFRYDDIDKDGVPEALVSRNGRLVSVNGWQMRPSKAKYAMVDEYAYNEIDPQTGETVERKTNLWNQQAKLSTAYREKYYDSDTLGEIYRAFGKFGLKPAARAAGFTGKIQFEGKLHPISFFRKPVAKILVGNALDDSLIQKYAEGITQKFGGTNKNDPHYGAALLSQLHRTKEYKDALAAGLKQYAIEAEEPYARVVSALQEYVRTGNPEIQAEIPGQVQEAVVNSLAQSGN